MPELPEVETTVRGLGQVLPGLTIVSVWSDYHIKGNRDFHKGKENIKDPIYFARFKKAVSNRQISAVERKGKNILIRLEEGPDILVHMKMTGHLMFGKYKKSKGAWIPKEEGPLKDPFNRFIHLVFRLSNDNYLVLSDVRRFAKVKYIDVREQLTELSDIGPDPLLRMSLKNFTKQISKKPLGFIKTVLMDQAIISGIGNIYSDEALFAAKIKPQTRVFELTEKNIKDILNELKKILKRSIALGGDSASDYRNVKGEKGGFQNYHNVYRRKGKKCMRSGCDGAIARTVINGRSSHYCPSCQK
jgi:formamidopyrimidine-DNA glycosylase